MLIFGRRYLTAVPTEYVEHYNTQRPHRGLQLHPAATSPDETKVAAVYRHPILGGLINAYHHAA